MTKDIPHITFNPATADNSGLEIVSIEQIAKRKNKAELVEQNLNPMTTEEYHAEIDQAMEDSKNGRMIKATDLKAKIQKWS